MYILLKLFNRVKSNSWYHLIIFIGLVYSIGTLLLFIEPTTFTDLRTYTWWFVVTSSTVGYGDVYPITGIGRLIGVIVIIGGVGALAMIIGKISEYVININRMNIKGLKNLNMTNHTVLLGYHKEETPYIISEILKDDAECKIIVCSDEIDENPFFNNNCVDFIKGRLISDDVLVRSNVKGASKILIHAPNDAESISVLLAVLNHNENDKTNIVMTIQDATYNKHVEDLVIKMNRNVETVTDLKIPMMVQSLLDSGSSDMVNQMLNNDGSAIRSKKYYGYRFTFSEYAKALLNDDIILIGVNNKFHPDRNLRIKDGDTIHYFSHERL